jgi:L-ribulose-5-phosphate 4-epimerase
MKRIDALNSLAEAVLEANRGVADHHLAVLTWGTASGLDRNRERMIIKPSGVDYYKLTVDDLVVIDMKTGEVIDGDLNPSVDTKIHLELYRAKEFAQMYGIVHTHSPKASAFAQAGKDLPILGTTTADYFRYNIPVTRPMTVEESAIDVVEKNTGLIILETFSDRKISPIECPAVLEASHGPFVWGKDPIEALHNAIVVEAVAGMAIDTYAINPDSDNVAKLSQHRFLVNFTRKHGPKSTYGQDAAVKYSQRI